MKIICQWSIHINSVCVFVIQVTSVHSTLNLRPRIHATTAPTTTPLVAVTSPPVSSAQLVNTALNGAWRSRQDCVPRAGIAFWEHGSPCRPALATIQVRVELVQIFLFIFCSSYFFFFFFFSYFFLGGQYSNLNFEISLFANEQGIRFSLVMSFAYVSNENHLSLTFTDFGCACPNDTTGGRCLAGTYCPAGASQPIQCDPGMFIFLFFFFLFFYN